MHVVCHTYAQRPLIAHGEASRRQLLWLVGDACVTTAQFALPLKGCVLACVFAGPHHPRERGSASGASIQTERLMQALHAGKVKKLLHSHVCRLMLMCGCLASCRVSVAAAVVVAAVAAMEVVATAAAAAATVVVVAAMVAGELLILLLD